MGKIIKLRKNLKKAFFFKSLQLVPFLDQDMRVLINQI